MTKATDFHLSGFICWTIGSNAELVVEGYLAEINSIEDVLLELVAQDILGNYEYEQERILRRRNPSFRILPDQNCKRTNFHRHGVQTGPYSGNEWEIASASSTKSD